MTAFCSRALVAEPRVSTHSRGPRAGICFLMLFASLSIRREWDRPSSHPDFGGLRRPHGWLGNDRSRQVAESMPWAHCDEGWVVSHAAGLDCRDMVIRRAHQMVRLVAMASMLAACPPDPKGSRVQTARRSQARPRRSKLFRRARPTRNWSKARPKSNARVGLTRRVTNVSIERHGSYPASGTVFTVISPMEQPNTDRKPSIRERLTCTMPQQYIHSALLPFLAPAANNRQP